VQVHSQPGNGRGVREDEADVSKKAPRFKVRSCLSTYHPSVLFILDSTKQRLSTLVEGLGVLVALRKYLEK
jgi:hypothetical protein